MVNVEFWNWFIPTIMSVTILACVWDDFKINRRK